MRKAMLVVAMLAMVVVSAIPALAQDEDGSLFNLEQEQVAESGNLNQSSNVVTSGSYNAVATDVNQVGNTGNVQEQVGSIQYGNNVED